MVEFEPKILAFLCNWCAYAGADFAGVSRMQYPSNIRAIRVMCSGRVDPSFILEALKNGADGIFIGTCHPGDCHYQTGNYKTIRRVLLTKKLLQQLGIEQERLRLEYISATEGKKFAVAVKDFVEKLRKLGPLKK
jgi:F420-non-reducing hydrogenase iron-sulfur subunit